MDRSTNESIRRGGWKVAIVLIAVAFVLFVLMLFSDSNQGATSLRDEVNRSTFKNTERLLAARTNSMMPVSMNSGPVTGKESTVTMITVASKKQREEELKKKIAEAMVR
jgi:hypothetical protein